MSDIVYGARVASLIQQVFDTLDLESLGRMRSGD
jgi:hypothetical protein